MSARRCHELVLGLRHALFLALGLGGCGAQVTAEDGGGGGGGEPPTTGGQSTGASPSVGGGSVGGAGGGVAGGSSVGGGIPVSGCENPVPVIVDGIDTGVDECEGGQLRRREEVACPSAPPDPNSCCGTCPDGYICSDQGEVACSCVTACKTDDECVTNGPGALCLCGAAGGVCVAAKCSTGADCAPGEDCTSWDASQGCLYLEFVCTTSKDSCGGDLDCTVPGELCQVGVDGVRSCQPGGCAIGRPFLVEGGERLAPLVNRSEWCGRERPSQPIGEEDRTVLAARWAVVGQMEHASVAAFARFTLQLLALGAPADLVLRTQGAAADEVRHAESAFALASRYGGRSVGPGPLDVDGALASMDLQEVVRLTVLEGCVGESVAAVEASLGAEGAKDPVVAGVLGGVADDERSHALLAWDFLRWALVARGATARAAANDVLRALEREVAAPLEVSARGEHDELVPGSGLLTDAARARLRRDVLETAVLPALRALLTREEAPRAHVPSA